MDRGLAPRRTAGLVTAIVCALLTSAPAGASPPPPDFSPLAGNPLAKPGVRPHAPRRATGPGEAKTAPKAAWADGTVLVRFRGGASAAARDGALERASAQAAGAVPGTRYVRVAPQGASEQAAVRSLDGDPAVADAVLDYERRAAAAPNDPQYVKGLQGNLDVFRLPAAWDRAKATKADVVAILDTGVDLEHPDLAPQLVPGRDVVNGDDRPDDDEGHGTAVAGIAAAGTGDGIGMAGVAWSGGIMPVKVLDHRGIGYDTDIAEGIAWAADHGADVISLSFAAPGASPVLDQAVAAARAKGAVVVAAAGNDSYGGPEAMYPAAAPGVLAVAATDWSGDHAFISNHGDWIDLAAPGIEMTRTWRSVHGDGEWRPQGWGTSYAAGFVAGAALLVRAQNPAWTPAQVESRLLTSAHDAGPPGADPYYGRGLVDPLAAVGGPRKPRVAPVVDADSTRATARLVTAGDYTGMLETEGDEDWYAIDMPQAGELGAGIFVPDFDVRDGRRLDAVLDFYDPSGRWVDRADSGYVDDEEEVWTWVPAGRSYVRVTNYAGSRQSSPYALWIDTAPSAGGEWRFAGDRIPRVRDAAGTAIADVTGDGHPDLLVTRAEADGGLTDTDTPAERKYDQLLVHPVDGDGEPGAGRAYDLGARAQAGGGDGGTTAAEEMDVTTGDVDGDGDEDVVTAVGRHIGVMRQQAGGLSAVEPVPGSRGARQVEVADLDRDGRLDLVGRLDGRRAGGTPVTGLVAYLQEPGGGFEATPLAGGTFTDVAVGDVNSDGRRDVVAITSGGVRINRQLAGGGWRLLAPLAESAPSNVEVADVTGDGLVDIVTAGVTDAGAGEVRVRRQTSAGVLASPAASALDRQADALAVARVGGDRRLDVVTADDIAIEVLEQRTDGTLGAARSHLGSQFFSPAPTGFAAADFTGDGYADVAVSADAFGYLSQRTALWPRAEWLRGATPAPGARDAATGVAPALRLGRALDAATVKAASVRLTRGDTGAAVAATPSYDAATRTLTVRPAAALAPGTPYALRIPGVRDAYGAAPPDDLVLRFATAGAADTTPPDTSFTGPGTTHARSWLWFGAHASEPGTGMQCSVDGAAFADCQPELYAEPDTDGAHTVRVRAVDAAGNVDPSPASRDFTTDSAGDEPANDQPEAARVLSGASGSVTGTTALADDEYEAISDPRGEYAWPSGDAWGGHSVYYRWTAPADGAVAFDTAGSAFDTTLTAILPGMEYRTGRRVAGNDDAAEGLKTSRMLFSARAGKAYLIVVDGFGQGDQAPNGAVKLGWSFAAGSDTAPPDTAIDAAPGAQAGVWAMVDFHGSEPGVAFECRREVGGQVRRDWYPCAAPERTGGQLGEVRFLVRAVDAAGNADPTPAERSWRAVAIPDTTIADGPPPATTERQATFGFGGTASAAGYECRLDRGAWAACASPHTVRDVAPGPHELQVRALDSLGRADQTPAGRDWTVLPDQVPALPAGASGGTAQAVKADFNGDGRSDLAVGVPGEDVGTVRDAGAVQILLGSSTGLTASGGRLWTRADPEVAGEPAAGDAFGASLAAGDFDGDGRDDLAIGAPGQTVNTYREAGTVHVLYGSATGPAGTRAQAWSQASTGIADDSERADAFGTVLAAGDADGDGRDDLAIGVPAESAGTVVDAGAAHLLRGADATGLTAAGSQRFTQGSTGVADDPEAGDRFGAALAFGRLDGDGRAELVLGAPGEDAGAIRDAGAVHVLPGASGGATATGSRLWTQESAGIDDAAEPYDRFGTVVATGELAGANAPSALAIGVPQEDAGTLRDSGAVHVLPGGAGGETATGSRLLTQDTSDVADAAEPGDRFGAALAAADLGGTAVAELIVGAPFEDAGAVADAGAIHVLPGGAAAGSSFWTQSSTDVGDVVEREDRFGAALAAGDYGGTDHAELAVAAPGESIGSARGAGLVNLFTGSASGVSAGAGRVWSQASAGVPDDAEAGDGFGAGLGG